MLPERIEKLKQEYTDQYVVVDGERPELARFKDLIGRVKTINFAGRALVEFEGNDNRGWYDIELDYLKVVDKPEPEPAAEQGEAAAKARPTKANAPSKCEAEEKLSPLELARMEKQAEEAARKPIASDAPTTEGAKNRDRRREEPPRTAAPDEHPGESDSK
jgi:hypothetical protein